ncbi:hypothetical protein ACFQX7_27560 [Luedemannella flava]
MTVVVGVHGIWQQQRGRQQLLAEWGTALGDGLERAGRRAASVALDIAFYGHLFLPDLQGKSAVDDIDLLGEVMPEELADLTDAVLEIDPGADLDDEYTKGAPAIPLPVQRLVRYVDRRFNLPVGALMLGELRQVRRYLCDPQLKAAVDRVVAEIVSGDTRVVVGHSLGTVVVLEYMRQHPGMVFDLLLTLGSPLGLRMIRRYLPDPTFGVAGGKPATVGRWVNVYDPHDAVAAAGG